MKKISLFIVMMLFTVVSADAQVGLEPNDSMALIKVATKNTKQTPIIGQKVSFVDKKTGDVFSGKSDSTGRFDILVPKGVTYDISVSIVGKDTTMSTYTIPSEPERIIISYTFIDRPPRVIKLDNVYFDTNKATLRRESFKMLNHLVEYLTVKPYINIEIAGHTDNTGGYEFNMSLSQRRAEAVRNYLIKAGISKKRLTAVGYGPNKPIDTNETERGKQNNRRTEVYPTSN